MRWLQVKAGNKKGWCACSACAAGRGQTNVAQEIGGVAAWPPDATGPASGVDHRCARTQCRELKAQKIRREKQIAKAESFRPRPGRAQVRRQGGLAAAEDQVLADPRGGAPMNARQMRTMAAGPWHRLDGKRGGHRPGRVAPRHRGPKQDKEQTEAASARKGTRPGCGDECAGPNRAQEEGESTSARVLSAVREISVEEEIEIGRQISGNLFGRCTLVADTSCRPTSTGWALDRNRKEGLGSEVTLG